MHKVMREMLQKGVWGVGVKRIGMQRFALKPAFVQDTKFTASLINHQAEGGYVFQQTCSEYQ